jgi:hypothetical protein
VKRHASQSPIDAKDRQDLRRSDIKINPSGPECIRTVNEDLA